MTTVVAILLSDIVPLRDRGVWQGIINIVYSAGAGIGAPAGEFSVSSPHCLKIPNCCSLTSSSNKGGFLADYVGWRW